ncbi:Histidinol dehydrogenase (fragment) [Methanoculleus bourgensis]|uniref:Histidinol dehydrogenase n=1 Tax=Methanoculleus bourgensis TaxID=83986 RepID=A0A0X3BJZ3_9EURY
MWKALDIETWIAGRRSDLDRVKGSVSEIIGRVRAEGDDALIDLTKKFDGIDLAEIAVSDEEREAAYDQVDAELVESLVQAEVRISRFHELQRGRDLWLQEMEPGITLGVKTTPLSRVGATSPAGGRHTPRRR